MTKPIRFRLSIPEPARHLVHVEMTIRALDDDASIDVALPAWTPGSYLLREYARFVRNLRALDPDGDRRVVTKQDKSTWRIDTLAAPEITLHYDVYAHDLNVRFSHVEQDHAFLHGPTLFMYPVERIGDEIEVVLDLPKPWKIWTGLKRSEGPAPVYQAANFDELFDCPILAGDLPSFEFSAAGVPHEFVMWGRGNYDLERIAHDTARVVEASARIFGGQLPYEHFQFLTLLTDDQYGGLEHRNSTALMYPRFSFVDRTNEDGCDEKYLDFMSLVSHEHFHVWNVKRIRPERLGPFDYQRENYTRDLWTVEGITSYYQWVSLLRAGVIDAKEFLNKLAKMIGAMLRSPGRKLSTLEQSSFDAWIKAYQPHPNNRNADISYYLKGALAAFALDVMIRVDTDGERSLDDVMRHLWHHYSKEQGYPEGGYEAIVKEVVGNDVSDFFDTFIRATTDPDWNDWLENIGLSLVSETKPTALPYFGFDADDSGSVRHVDAGGPAESALYPGDRVIAVDGYEADGKLENLLRETTAGVPARFHLFRRGELVEATVTPAEPLPTKWQLQRRSDADPRAISLLAQWLGTSDLPGSEEE